MTQPVLALNNVEVRYQGSILVLKNLSLTVEPGEIVALLGSNGAGKSTTLKAVSGLLDAEEGAVTEGSLVIEGDDMTNADPVEVVRRGVIQVLEGRRVLSHLTVEQNLMVASVGARSSRTEAHDDMQYVYGLFPVLQQFRKRTAGYLSGGQQQMLVLGRALMGRPKLLMLDEPSLGLAPSIEHEIFAAITKINASQGVAVLLVEQNARAALRIAHRGYVLETGRVVLSGDRAALLGNKDLQEFYLGLGSDGTRKSFRDVKHYKRRKRWVG
ncbi:ABC transporter ATP-binding protein [Acrocarpospora pleiomorpha]|uniref:ABC transporter ATP-binding protein n=1 Tax=Acrocarpospora pleiomorpha TaxID=90975 RepID=A0A5M3XE78_9ACTN|nr:ABC transporter ATP-binding protein [Acrocarpospora pleiomorpha]GES19370.1 ABC transporter ATP-binding protein [Acrocarpospora pleiomorpha]